MFYTVVSSLGIWGSLILFMMPSMFWMIAVQDRNVSFEGNFVWHFVIGSIMWVLNWAFHFTFLNQLKA